MKKALICIILIAAAAAAFAQSSSEVGGNNPEIGIVDPDNPVTNDNPVTAEVVILTSIHTSDWLYNPNQIADFKVKNIGSFENTGRTLMIYLGFGDTDFDYTVNDYVAYSAPWKGAGEYRITEPTSWQGAADYTDFAENEVTAIRIQINGEGDTYSGQELKWEMNFIDRTDDEPIISGPAAEEPIVPEPAAFAYGALGLSFMPTLKRKLRK